MSSQTVVHSLIIFLLMILLFLVGRHILVPIFFSILLLYVVHGFATRLKWWIRRSKEPAGIRWSLLSLLIILVILGFLGWVFFLYLGRILQQAPQYQESILNATQWVVAELGWQSEPTWETIRREIFERVNIQGLLLQTIQSLTSALSGIIVVLMLSLFLLLEKAQFARKLKNAANDPIRFENWLRLVDRISNKVGAYLLLKSFVSFLVALSSGLLMTVLGVEFAVFWSICIFFLNFIPYLGSVISVVLPTSYAAFLLGDVYIVIQLCLGLLVLQFIIGNLLDPYLMGNTLNLSPLAILLSLMFWGSIWGISGAFLAVPVTACLQIFLSYFPGTRPVAVFLSEKGDIDA